MRRIHTKLVYEYRDGQYVLTHEDGFWYDGPVALCKGDNTAKQAEQQQMQFNAKLMNIFSTQFANQQSTLNYLKGVLTPMINNPTGYSAAALAAMRTGATDQLSTAYQNAQKANQNVEAVRSGDLASGSGVNAQINASLLNSEATDKANAQNNITLQDENLKESNYWNAINGLNGIAAENNPLGYAQTATQGAGAVANLSQAVTASDQSQLLGALGGAVGGALSGAGQAGGFGKLFCWVAAASFNEPFDGQNTSIVRNWLLTTWSKNWYASPILWVYSKVGRWVSTKPVLVNLLKPLFEAALMRAKEDSCQHIQER